MDEEILQRLREEAAKSRVPFRSLLNRVLRLGLEQLEPQGSPASYEFPTFSMGIPAYPNPDKALQYAADLEDEEILHKLALRK